MVFRTGGSALAVFIGQMKRRPNPTVALSVAEERDFFRRHRRNAERIKQEDQLAMLTAADERIEVAGSLPRVEIGERTTPLSCSSLRKSCWLLR